MTGDTALRFWEKVDTTGECWLWTGGTNGRGYGRFSVEGRLVYAHRWSHEAEHGPLDAIFVVDHLCRNPRCVRPSHLEAVPKGINTARGILGFDLDGTCRSGRHDMTTPGAYYIVPATGSRRCRACHREANRRYVA